MPISNAESLLVRLWERVTGWLRRRPLDSRQARGAQAERAAARYLRQHGYRILQRNLRTKLGEIDIVAEHNGWLVVVEVRSRSEDSPVSPQAGLTRAKQRKLRQLTEQLRKQDHLSHLPVRVDLVEVITDQQSRIHSIQVLEGLPLSDR